MYTPGRNKCNFDGYHHNPAVAGIKTSLLCLFHTVDRPTYKYKRVHTFLKRLDLQKITLLFTTPFELALMIEYS